MPLILDNIDTSLETTMLKSLASSHSLDAAVGYFNLRGWRLIADAVDALPRQNPNKPKVRLLVGMTEAPANELRRLMRLQNEQPVTNKIVTQHKQDVLKELRDQLQVGLPTIGDEAALQNLRRQIADGDVEVKLFLAHRLHAKLYLCHRDDTAAPRVGYVGSSNLTNAGLREQGELNVDVLDTDATTKLARWFDDRWDDHFTIFANPELIELLDESWASNTPLDPYLVYLKMAYHLSDEARKGLIQYGLPASMSDKLLEFQAAAVKIAARIINQRGGAMVGDVVGLGKTMVGTAIARLLQEENGFETLIVCPKNLVNMWESYRHEFKLHGRVLSLSMVTRELPNMRRHRLVLVDESHNLRNPKRKDYKALYDYITENDSKVLLLTATPYNKGFADIAAQIALFVRPDDDLGIRPTRAIEEHGEAEFAAMCEGQTSTLGAFKASEHLGDWQDLMSQFLVRRTRRFIQDNYAHKDKKDTDDRPYLTFGDGRQFYFPEREAIPVEREVAPSDPAAAMMSQHTIDAIANLLLPRYNLARYLDPLKTPTEDEQEIIDDLHKSANGNLSGFNRIMMFKRLTSSGPAFLATLRRHALRNLVALHAIDHHLPLPVGSVDNALWSAELDTQEGDLFEEGLFKHNEVPDLAIPMTAYQKLADAQPGRVRWLQPDLFTKKFGDALRADTQTIRALLNEFGDWDAKNDGKITSLEDLITQKHPKEKVLVFTEAADTAAYVALELEQRGVKGVAAVTGDSENPTALACRFSPGANRGITHDHSQPELQVLISTDVLSEGQNLQDARIVVNYDLPWAIVRLVQRAGRIDRIGQQAKTVLVYSLMPAGSVDDEINLRGRIRGRLEENAELLGSDEKFFGNHTERAIITGLYDEHSDFRLADVGKDVDPVSMAYEIWRKAKDRHPDLATKVESLPNVVYATKQARPGESATGVLVHSQTVAGSDAFAFTGTDGESRHITPQEALRRARCEPETKPAVHLEDHHEMVATALNGPLRASPSKATGALLGVRGQCWRKLHTHRTTMKPSLFTDADELDTVLDAINERPLKETVKQKLSSAIRNRTTEDLAALVIQLHRDGQLCLPAPQSGTQTEPSIIGSLGLRRS
ncbi:MAG: NgoFVII family restriction endonuclease [Acidimicrobiia bacterium]|nr:NgoFVII family restriction endonuclease [Acidimicrobiia bacterium]MYC57915.1 NgoFVII family restriction endonuclease [Acidimicrobiia bacterium]MYI29838.1 NgoFVII family restriction endonuclease [Acidimicrobiia bacterium]